MVEMTETAAILRSATSRSLAFFDEVGRGTSTYDGMALARAIVEYLARPGQGCRTIFSTHYHELAAIERERSTVRNRQMEVRETADQVAFTYRVIDGAADRSYGVHVARLAGLPPSVVGRAAQVLAALEAGGGSSDVPGRQEAARVAPPLPDLILKLADLDVDRMTPVEALACLDEIRRDATSLVARVATQAPVTDGTPAAATE
jgi:DNA mismatch repair protein MutS